MTRPHEPNSSNRAQGRTYLDLDVDPGGDGNLRRALQAAQARVLRADARVGRFRQRVKALERDARSPYRVEQGPLWANARIARLERERAQLRNRLAISRWVVESIRARRWWRLGVALTELWSRPTRIIPFAKALRGVAAESDLPPKPSLDPIPGAANPAAAVTTVSVAATAGSDGRLRLGGAATGPSYRDIPAGDILERLDDWSSSGSRLVEQLANRPPVAEPFRYRARDASATDRAALDDLLAGRFRPHQIFDEISSPMPPSWEANPFESSTWDFYRHSLEWVEPAIVASVTDDRARDLFASVVTDWAAHNANPPGASRFAWNDHAVAVRSRLLVFAWEVLGKAARLDLETSSMIIALLLQHGAFLADDGNYAVGSNHGLEMDASLLVLACSMPDVRYAEMWRSVAVRRLLNYLSDNFSEAGFHLEQSPGYHTFVMFRIAGLDRFGRVNGFGFPTELTDTVTRCAAVWPWLVRQNGTVPMFGDTPEVVRPPHWRRNLEGILGRGVETDPGWWNPRGDGTSLLVDAEAGYAVLAAYPIAGGGSSGDSDLHLTIKVNNFESPHVHVDGMSFVLYAFGHDWISDSGYYNYEEASAMRRYMRAARAHNVVLADDDDFDLAPATVDRVSRTASGDEISMTTDHTVFHQRRSFRVDHAAVEIGLSDQVTSHDGRPHLWSQLFHVHPSLDVLTTEERQVVLADDMGNRLAITQVGEVEVEVLAGEVDGTLRSFYSPRFGEVVPNRVLVFRSVSAGTESAFETLFAFSTA